MDLHTAESQCSWAPGVGPREGLGRGVMWAVGSQGVEGGGLVEQYDHVVGGTGELVPDEQSLGEHVEPGVGGEVGDHVVGGPAGLEPVGPKEEFQED